MRTFEEMVKFWGVQPLLRNMADTIANEAKPGTFSQFYNPFVARKLMALADELAAIEKEEGRRYLDIVMSVTRSHRKEE